jgi:PiT family inorganic phosphate transporter
MSGLFGYSLSTTHVATGSILGSGVGMPGAKVRWGVAGRMLAAWGLTLPAAGLVGAACYGIQHGIGGAAGTVVVFAILVATSVAIWVASRRKPVDHNNVNDAWEEGAVDAGLETEAVEAREAALERRLDAADPFTDAEPQAASSVPASGAPTVTPTAARQRASV